MTSPRFQGDMYFNCIISVDYEEIAARPSFIIGGDDSSDSENEVRTKPVIETSTIGVQTEAVDIVDSCMKEEWKDQPMRSLDECLHIMNVKVSDMIF